MTEKVAEAMIAISAMAAPKEIFLFILTLHVLIFGSPGIRPGAKT